VKLKSSKKLLALRYFDEDHFIPYSFSDVWRYWFRSGSVYNRSYEANCDLITERINETYKKY